MKIYRILFLFCFITTSLTSQINFDIYDDFKYVDFKNFIEVYQTKDNIHPNELLENKNLKWESNRESYGFTENYFWLRFSITNKSNSFKSLYLLIDNPHFRYVDYYENINDNIVKKHESGRHLPFDNRPIDNVKNVFPVRLQNNETKTIYLKIDKRFSSVSFPISLWEKNNYSKLYNKFNLVNGIYFGGIMLMFLFALIAYFNFKRNLYLKYAFYTLFLGLYMFTTVGYLFQYIILDNIWLNSYIRVVFLTLMIFFHAKFIQSLFKTKEHNHKLHLSINFFTTLYLSLTVLWIIIDQFNKSFVTLYLKTNYIIILILLVHFIVACYYTYRFQKKIVKLYLFSFSCIILAAVWLVLEEYGLFPKIHTTISPLYLGSLIEIIILSIVLISEMRIIANEKEKLNLSIAEKQQEIIKAYINGIEKEKFRISSELHDDIGSKLSNLNQHLATKYNFSNKTKTKIERIIDDVRNLSHKLSSNKINLFSYKEQIINVIEETLSNKNTSYNLIFSESIDFLSKTAQLNIYRILQESLQNIVKHSYANNVDIQFSLVDDNLILTIEDDGVGFDSNLKKEGIGLINMKKRVHYLKGTIEISSITTKGTFLLITLPISTIKK